MQQQSIAHSGTTNGSSNMSNSSSMMGVNGVIKLPGLSSPMEHQPMHQAMLFGSVTSSSNVVPVNPSVSVGMMMPLTQVNTVTSTEPNGVSILKLRNTAALRRSHISQNT